LGIASGRHGLGSPCGSEYLQVPNGIKKDPVYVEHPVAGGIPDIQMAVINDYPLFAVRGPGNAIVSRP
jgi:hypothetical protein